MNYFSETCFRLFNTNTVNVFKAGYNRSNLFRTQQGQGVTDYAMQYGLENVTPVQQQWTPPSIGITNYTSLGDPYAPQGAIQNRFQYTDELSWKHGNHTFIFGGDFVRTQFNGNWVVGNNGIYNFSRQVSQARAQNNGKRWAEGGTLLDSGGCLHYLVIGHTTKLPVIKRNNDPLQAYIIFSRNCKREAQRRIDCGSPLCFFPFQT